MPVSTRLATRLPRATSLVEDRAAEPEVGVVGERDGGVLVLDAEEHRHRAEEFVAEGGVVRLDIRQDRRRHEGAGTVDALAAHRAPWHPCATAASTCFSSSTRAASVDSGPSVVFSSIGSPGFSAFSAAWNFSRNLSASCLDDDEALGRAAGLAGIVHPAPHRPGDRVIKVGVLKDDEGVAAAEFHRRRPSGSCPARAAMLWPAATLPVSATPLMRGSSTTWSRLIVRDQQVGVEADWRAGFDQQLFEGDRALRHDACVLHHQGVARHQMRAGDSRQLVVGEVPGLDAEDDTDRAAFHVGFADGRVQLHRCEEALGVLGVVGEDPAS